MTFGANDDGEVRKGPDAFRTISEVAEDLGLPQHVLRFWESRFPQIKPVKRGGGRRYYRPNDVELLRGVKKLLYGEGYTIRGVQRILREQGGRKLAQAAGRDPDVTNASAPPPAQYGFDPGPELWAPARRATVQPAVDPLPETAPHVEAETPVVHEPVAEFVAAPPLPPAARDRLTPDQAARLTAALDDLLACRALVEARTR